MTTLANSWRQFALYGVAMCALSVAAMGAGYALSESIWTASTKRTAEQPRASSRVEKYFAAKAAAAKAAARAETVPYRPVVALERPDIHPAELAAALDRTELASAIEYPEHYRTATADVSLPALEGGLASWRPATAYVAGIVCLPTECHESRVSSHIDQPQAEQSTPTEMASLDKDAADIAFATSDGAVSDGFTSEPLVKPLPKPYKLGKDRAATARQKPSRKVLSQDAGGPGILKFFAGPGAASLRVADTPGDIISRTLRGTI